MIVIGDFLNKDGSFTATKQTSGDNESYAVIAYVGSVANYFSHFLALALYFAVVATQNGLYLGFGLGGRYKIDPCGVYMLRLRGKNLYLVATLQFVTQRYQLVVYLGTDTMTT